MQKVEGPNPFGRFAETPPPSGVSSFLGSICRYEGAPGRVGIDCA